MTEFDRYTDRARKVILLAKEEARATGYPSVDPVHILLAMLKEGQCIAANTLRNLGVSIKQIREVMHMQYTYCGELPNCSSMPFELSVIKMFEDAVEEAAKLGHNYIGTEHLLLGFIKSANDDNDNFLGFNNILRYLKITPKEIREETLDLLGATIENERAEEKMKEKGEVAKMMEEAATAKAISDNFYNQWLKPAHVIKANSAERGVSFVVKKGSIITEYAPSKDTVEGKHWTTNKSKSFMTLSDFTVLITEDLPVVEVETSD